MKGLPTKNSRPVFVKIKDHIHLESYPHGGSNYKAYIQSLFGSVIKIKFHSGGNDPLYTPYTAGGWILRADLFEKIILKEENPEYFL